MPNSAAVELVKCQRKDELVKEGQSSRHLYAYLAIKQSL